MKNNKKMLFENITFFIFKNIKQKTFFQENKKNKDKKKIRKIKNKRSKNILRLCLVLKRKKY
ncbi:unnamed protein product, partial [Vitis vinifera]